MTLPIHKTYFQLNQRLGWRLPGDRGKVDGDPPEFLAPMALRLPAKSGGPFSVHSSDGTVGGLTMVRSMTHDQDLRLIISVVENKKLVIKRYDPLDQAFAPFEAFSDDHEYKSAPPILYDRGVLFTPSQDNAAIRAFDITAGEERRFTIQDQNTAPGLTAIVDMTVWRGQIVLLDAKTRSLLFIDRRSFNLQRRLVLDGLKPSASRLLVDTKDNIWILTRRGLQLLLAPTPVRASDNAVWMRTEWQITDILVHDAYTVAHLFSAPVIRPFPGKDGTPVFMVPVTLAQPFKRKWPEQNVPVQAPGLDYYERRRRCDNRSELDALDRLIFGLDGNAKAAYARYNIPDLFEKQGTWDFEVLDSELPQCQWHRATLELEHLPGEHRLSLWAYATDHLAEPGTDLDLKFDLVTRFKSSPDTKSDASTHQLSALFRKDIGRYLYLRLIVEGDAYSSPSILSLRIEYPRHAYRHLLPAIFNSREFNQVSEYFLSRYLSLVETEWDTLERTIAEQHTLFKPGAGSDGLNPHFLATWLGSKLPPDIDHQRARAILKELSLNLGSIGTLKSVQSVLAAFLDPENYKNAPTIPVLVEGYRERRRSLRITDDNATASGQEFLVSTADDGRFRIGSNATLGKVRLKRKSITDLSSDIFERFAHKLKIFVPAALLEHETVHQQFLQLVAMLVPAHITTDVIKTYARARIGLQSYCGIDTIVSEYPPSAIEATERDEPMTLWRDWGLGLIESGLSDASEF